MFKQWSKMHGMRYLFDNLAVFTQQIEAANISDTGIDLLQLDIEVDENKADGEVDIESNAYKLQFVTTKVFSAILSSAESIPRFVEMTYLTFRDFRIMFSTVNEGMADKIEFSEDAKYSAIGGLYFLRFLIPSIFAPHAYGLLPEPPCEKTQRTLILVSKVIQNIANMTMPKKEPFMLALSSFIGRSIPKVKGFYNKLVV